jgi:hypothetical protein
VQASQGKFNLQNPDQPKSVKSYDDGSGGFCGVLSGKETTTVPLGSSEVRKVFELSKYLYYFNNCLVLC